jgi:hypothetical protein
MAITNFGRFSKCVCLKYNNLLATCINEFTICEEGKAVKLTPQIGEKVTVIIIDGCAIRDSKTKCDALFLWDKGNKKYSFLVELKGAGDIEKAFIQLSYTRDYRPEYKELIELFSQNMHVSQKYRIVSNGMLTKIQQEQLEELYNIRIHAILHSEPTMEIPDLRNYV